LTVAEEGGDNYEVFFRGEGFVFSNEPFVVGNCYDGQLQVEKSDSSTHSQNTSLGIL
jgi:hypothetical protein